MLLESVLANREILYLKMHIFPIEDGHFCFAILFFRECI